MLLNTRNFLLYLLAVGFLVVAVTTTALTKNQNQEASVIMGTKSDVVPTYEAEAVIPETVDRAERLRTLRSKIAALGEVFTGEPEPEVEVSEVPATAVVDDPGNSESLVCGSQSTFTGAWTPGSVTFTVVEGARLVTRDVSVSTTTASGTIETTLNKVVLAQLPLRSGPLSDPSCIATDVVGIAGDGSLIRNGEVGLYSVFDSETLVGYALDGFPIYGKNPGTTLDTCGGTSTLGQYRYYLDPLRPQILNCFAGIPVAL